ncbi:Regulator of G-protein signaling 14 [Balamuthia mandrillaris]
MLKRSKHGSRSDLAQGASSPISSSPLSERKSRSNSNTSSPLTENRNKGGEGGGKKTKKEKDKGKAKEDASGEITNKASKKKEKKNKKKERRGSKSKADKEGGLKKIQSSPFPTGSTISSPTQASSSQHELGTLVEEVQAKGKAGVPPVTLLSMTLSAGSRRGSFRSAPTSPSSSTSPSPPCPDSPATPSSLAFETTLINTKKKKHKEGATQSSSTTPSTPSITKNTMKTSEPEEQEEEDMRTHDFERASDLFRASSGIIRTSSFILPPTPTSFVEEWKDELLTNWKQRKWLSSPSSPSKPTSGPAPEEDPPVTRRRSQTTGSMKPTIHKIRLTSLVQTFEAEIATPHRRKDSLSSLTQPLPLHHLPPHLQPNNAATPRRGRAMQHLSADLTAALSTSSSGSGSSPLRVRMNRSGSTGSIRRHHHHYPLDTSSSWAWSSMSNSLSGSNTSMHLSPRMLELSLEMSKAYFLNCILKDKEARRVFMKFLRQRHCAENLMFWVDVERYRRLETKGELLTKAKEIEEKYLLPTSEFEINLTHQQRTELQEGLKEPHPETFVNAQKSIFLLMVHGTFDYFLRSERYRLYKS